MQGNEAPASAPGGAVAPAMKPVAAWPFPTDVTVPADKPKPGGAKAPQGNEASALADADLQRAIKAIKKAKAVSVRLLKTELGVGTGRAMKLIDELEAAGHIGPANGKAPREVLA
jgi:S-DNA-T family DNA segregation ATPase FtsK/SpoIIIE